MDRGDLGDQILHVARALRRAHAEALAPLGLSPHHARALRIIGRHEPVRPSLLAERLRIAPRSVTDVVDALVERSWVTRSPDPDDRRASLLTLTADGRDMAEKIAAVRREQSRELFEVLPDADVDALGRILAQIDAAPVRR